MPQIPIAISKETIPGTTGLPMNPMEDQVGSALQRGGAQLENTFGDINQQIQNAERLVEASKHENFLKTWADKKVEALKGRTDYENFESEAESNLTELNDYISKISDRKVRQAVEVSAQHTIRDYTGTVRVKKVEALTDVGKANLEQIINSDVESWINANPEPKTPYGLRNDGTAKGKGYFGEVPVVSGGRQTGKATEYSVGVKIGGKEVEIPSLVPTLTPEEVKLMAEDIIPNNKKIPQEILDKAIKHAEARIARGESPFADTPEAEPSERDIIKAGIESKIIAAANAGIIKQSEAITSIKALDAKLEESYARELINKDQAIELKKQFDSGGLTSIDPVKRQELYALTKAKAKEQEATNILVELQTKYVDNPENPLHEDGTRKTPLELRADAWKEITSTDFLKKYGADMQHAVMQHWSENENKLRDEYKIKADEVKGALIVDILNRNMRKGGLTGDDRWLSLTASDRAYVSNFADAQRRADRSEAMSARSLNMQAQQIKKQNQQEDAQAFSLKMLSNIASGKYTDENQIIKDCTVKNPYILKSVNSYLSTFKTIASAPDLKQGIAEINKAAKAGSLDKDYQRSIIMGGDLATTLRTKYMSEPDFRGAKINEWIRAQIEPNKKRTVGDILNGFWNGVVQGTYDANIKEYNTPPQKAKKYVGTKNGKPVYELPNGKWQIGE